MTESKNDLPPKIGKPALRALLHANITSLEQASRLTNEELLGLHGVGPKAVRILRESILKSEPVTTPDRPTQ